MNSHCVILHESDWATLQKRLDAALTDFSHALPTDLDAPVVLKPNLNANMNALTGNTTDLRLLAAVVAFLKDRGHTDLTIAEGTNSGFYRSRIGVIARLKVDALGRHFGVVVKDLNYAEPVAIPFEDGLTAHVARDCMEAACLINMPVIKTHFENGMTVCLKNLMGCLVGQENKKKTHQNLAANIVRITEAMPPHLHVVDGLVAMEGLGPTRGVPRELNCVLVGEDPFLLDLLCARIAGFPWRDVRTLAHAEAEGKLTPEHHEAATAMAIPRVPPFAPPKAGPLATFIHSPKRQKYFLAVRNTPFFTKLAATGWFGELLFRTGLRQDKFIQDEPRLERLHFDASRCEDCGTCADFCPLGGDPRRTHAPDADSLAGEACLGCLYCQMVCPRTAFAIEGELGFLAEQLRQYETMIRQFKSKRSRP